MNNLVAFINSFLAYLMMFAISAGLVTAAALIGIRLRKNKDGREGLLTEKE